MPTTDLKKLVAFALTLVELISDFADGFSFSLIAKVVEVAKAAGPALGGAQAALAQYVAMTDAEALDLEAFVMTDFDIPDDKVEKAIEGGLQVAIQLHGLVALFVPKKPA